MDNLDYLRAKLANRFEPEPCSAYAGQDLSEYLASPEQRSVNEIVDAVIAKQRISAPELDRVCAALTRAKELACSAVQGISQGDAQFLEERGIKWE